jgi:hypothetical protein
MLEEFLWKHDIDIILLQEVTSTQIETRRRYTTFVNIGAEQRGTAILVKDGLTITHTKRLPSGRGIAGTFNGTWFVNILYMRPPGQRKNMKEEPFIIQISLISCQISRLTSYWLGILTVYCLSLTLRDRKITVELSTTLYEAIILQT